MKINKSLRKEIESFLPSNYRKTIVERLGAKGICIHPNTVYNVLNGTENDTVAAELVKLASECKSEKEKVHKQLSKNLQQLSAA